MDPLSLVLWLAYEDCRTEKKPCSSFWTSEGEPGSMYGTCETLRFSHGGRTGWWCRRRDEGSEETDESVSIVAASSCWQEGDILFNGSLQNTELGR